MSEYSPYQRKVINNYYTHRDSIQVGRLQELISEMYLADSDKKRARLWERAASTMRNLKWKPALIDHILLQKKPELLASHLTDWMKESG